jgi:hypothetical protein
VNSMQMEMSLAKSPNKVCFYKLSAALRRAASLVVRALRWCAQQR